MVRGRLEGARTATAALRSRARHRLRRALRRLDACRLAARRLHPRVPAGHAAVARSLCNPETVERRLLIEDYVFTQTGRKVDKLYEEQNK